MIENTSNESDGSTYRPDRRTISFQLLVAVNTTLAVLLAIFLAYDHRREFANRLNDKHIALEEEARTLLPAVTQMRHHGVNEIQRYIDDVCALMHDMASPGHHIVVRLDDEFIQAAAHRLDSPEMVEAMQRATESPTHIAAAKYTELVVGAFHKNGCTVYVSEWLAPIRTSIIGDLVRRTVGIVALGLVAAAVVNVVLWRIVTRPIHQLVDAVQTIGQGQFGVQSSAFTSKELNYLADEVNSMSSSLADADEYRTSQMEKAREIQHHLQPDGVDIAGLSVAHLFQPADEVGGDYYDILRLADDSWLFCVADVVGQGVPAAMCAAMLKTHLVYVTERLTDPAEILSAVNERFRETVFSGNTVSMAMARVTPDRSQLQHASAGHETSWVVSVDGSLHELPSTGPILGIEDDATWGIITIDVAPGDRLYAFTDGMTEISNEREECFGSSRLAEVFSETGRLSLEKTIQEIDGTLRGFRGNTPQRDDCTLLIVEFHRNQVG